MEHGPGNALARLTATFEGSAVTAIDYAGQPMMMAHEVGKVLGFSDATRFTSALGEYGLIEGKHFVKLVGPELAAFKTALPDAVNARTPNLVLLTETGMYRALMRSRAPRAEAFQEWLASELLPQLRKTGTYSLAVTPDQIEAEARATLLAELHKSGQIDDRALVQRLNDAQLAALPPETTTRLIRSLSGEPTAAVALCRTKRIDRRRTSQDSAQVIDVLKRWTFDNWHRIIDEENPKSRAPRGGWDGIWKLDGTLCIRASLATQALKHAGYDPKASYRKLRTDGLLEGEPGDSERGYRFSRPVRIGSPGIITRCLVVTVGGPHAAGK